MKYLVVGTGGVGGSIAGFLALAGKDVTCIARGKHLEAIRRNGLHLKSDLKGEHFLPVKACTAEAFEGKADVIFVCVKGYSIDSIKEVLEHASTPDTLVIPILNVYGTGPRIGRLVPSVHVLDGCIYIVGFVSGEGEITSKPKCRMTSTETRLSNGHSFRLWLVQEPITMCQWAKCSTKVKYVIPLSDYHKKVRK